MSRFEEVGLTWGGKEYKVAPDKVMGLIWSIETIVTMEEINQMLESGTIRRAQVSRAYMSALNYAGAKVTDEEVYNSFFGENMLEDTVTVMVGLLAMMIPPEHLRSKQNPVQAKKKTVAVKKSPAKRSKSR
jgi:hypothetical protein